MNSSSSKEKFSLIYDQYIGKIYRFVYLKVNSQEIAEDVTSKVFLKSWEAYQKEKEIKNPGAFLYKIASNMVVDHYREKGKQKIVPMDQAPQLSDPRTNLYEKAILTADIELVKLAIGRIKKEYQDILIWYYLEDMSSEEISGIINKPVGTVRVMIHRGLDSLKEELNQEA